MKAQALHGHLDALLLAVLEEGALHGYAIIEALRARSGGSLDLPTGTIYPALRRLERAGLRGEQLEHGQRAGAADVPAHRLRPAGAGRRARRLARVQHDGRPLPRPGHPPTAPA